MKRTAIRLMVALATFALVTAPARHSVADDETGDTDIDIQAPLEAADCGASPPTITVLGLTIDVSAATFGHGDGADDPTPTPEAVDDGGVSHSGGSRPPGCY